MKNKLFGLLVVSTLLYSNSLVRNKDKVLDTTHNLMWQDHPHNTKYTFTHPKAIEYCQNLTLGGFSNWRLPTVEEYKYIIDTTRKDEVLINKKFRYIIKDDYWTDDRTWYRNFGKYAYYIMIKSGHAYYQNRTYNKYVRCIRDM